MRQETKTKKSRNCLRDLDLPHFMGNFLTYGAEERTRTSTPRRELHPECSASANSATSAHGHASIIRNPAPTLGRIALTAICHLAIQP